MKRVTIVAGLLALSACGPPSDRWLERHFTSHERQFAELLKLSQPNRSAPQQIALNRTLALLELKAPVPHAPEGSLWFYADNGKSRDGAVKGYVHSEKELTPLAVDLDQLPATDDGARFKKLRNRWYVFREHVQ